MTGPSRLYGVLDVLREGTFTPVQRDALVELLYAIDLATDQATKAAQRDLGDAVFAAWPTAGYWEQVSDRYAAVLARLREAAS